MTTVSKKLIMLTVLWQTDTTRRFQSCPATWSKACPAPNSICDDTRRNTCASGLQWHERCNSCSWLALSRTDRLAAKQLLSLLTFTISRRRLFLCYQTTARRKRSRPNSGDRGLCVKWCSIAPVDVAPCTSRNPACMRLIEYSIILEQSHFTALRRCGLHLIFNIKDWSEQ